MEGVIYALAHPVTGELRYVGKTKGDPRKRLREHVRGAARGLVRHRRLYSWIRSLGSDPALVVLEENPPDLNEAERGWIARLRAEGARLCNVLDGGDGWTPGRPQSPESNRKRGETLRSQPWEFTEGRRLHVESHRGRKRSDETRSKIAAKALGRVPGNKRVWTPELRERALGLYTRMSAEDAARELGIGRNQMFRFLRAEGVVRQCHERVGE